MSVPSASTTKRSFRSAEYLSFIRCFAKRQSTSYSVWSMVITLSAETFRSISRRKQCPICSSESLWNRLGSEKYRVNHFSYGLAPNVLGYRHPAAILDRSKNKCCGLITDGEELKNNQLCFSVDTTVLHLFSDLSRTCPRTSGGWIPPLALTPKNNRSVSFLVA